MRQFLLPQMNPRDKAGVLYILKIVRSFISLPSGRNPFGVNKSLLLSGCLVLAVFGDKATLIYHHGDRVQPQAAPGAHRSWDSAGTPELCGCFHTSPSHLCKIKSWNR